MTYPINYQNQQIPGYSGITINITNPNIGAGPQGSQSVSHNHGACNDPYCINCNPRMSNPISNTHNVENLNTTNVNSVTQTQSSIPPQPYYQDLVQSPQSMNQKAVDNVEGLSQKENYSSQEISQIPSNTKPQAQQSYPPEYYINNYNYVQNGKGVESIQSAGQNNSLNSVATEQVEPQPDSFNQSLTGQGDSAQEDMTSSKNIINELDTRLNEQKELEKNGKKTRIVALTNEYIMSLENYLNNPNTEIRLMAAKEILTRLDEDKNRYDDAALNALLNKMLQDPEKLVRIAALSALSSQLASGNDYTVKLLTDIQSNPNADKEDVVEAANILLKMSAATEVKYTPQENQNVISEQKVE